MPEVFVTFHDLKTFGVPWSRVWLGRLMDEGVFPPAVSLSANRIVWRKVDIERFLASRPLQGAPAPALWPRRPRPAKPVQRDKPIGRPKGSKVVIAPDGRRRLVLPEELRGAGDAA